MPTFFSKSGTGFPGAGSPNWMSAYPTILHTVWKHSGDTDLIRDHWPQLERYLGWYERKLLTITSFAENPFEADNPPGDWCPPPPVPGSFWDPSLDITEDIASGLGEAECGHTGWNKPRTRYTNASLFTDKNLSSAFSYLKDKKLIAEMGRAIGANGSGTAGITPALRRNFHDSFFHGDHYGSGLNAAQSENLMPLLLELPESMDKQRVVEFLLRDIMSKHQNHTSSGILGLRALFEALPQLGFADVALAMLLRDDYPSFGYHISHPMEPATTTWELFDAPLEGSSMNSRNHVMFATPSYFLFSAVAGIEPIEGDKLWRVAPAVVDASDAVHWARATVWTIRGSLASSWSLTSSSPYALSMNVTVPIGLEVLAALPLPGRDPSAASRCEVSSRGGGSLWADGRFVVDRPKDGVRAASVTRDARAPAITVSLQSGQHGLHMLCPSSAGDKVSFV